MSNNDVVGMGFSSAAYEHPRPFSVDDMVMGDLFKIKNPKYPYEHGFFEYADSHEKHNDRGFFIKTRTRESFLLEFDDIERANLTINIDGIDCDLDMGEYEEVIEILKKHRGKK